MRKVMLVGCVTAILACVAGCPPSDQQQEAKAFILVSGDATGSVIAKDAVQLADIASLKVTITEVVLDRLVVPNEGEGEGEVGEGEGEGEVGEGEGEVGEGEGEGEVGEGEGEGEGEIGEGEGEGEVVAKDAEDGDTEQVIVFSGERQIDLIDLTGVSAILSEAALEPGTYTKIRLSVKDPEMRLASDPETPITNIQLTANGRLFISETFEVPEGQTLITLDFQGMHLVQTGNGNGKYVWTPQLRADISTQSAAVSTTATIESVDTEAGTMVVTSDATDPITVNYSGAAIYLPADTDTATGTAAALVVGASVTVEGVLDVSGVVTASSIRIL